MLVRNTILAPVVILDSQGPQQQGWVTDRNHNILSRLHHIVVIMMSQAFNILVVQDIHKQMRRPVTKNSLMVQQLSPGIETCESLLGPQ